MSLKSMLTAITFAFVVVEQQRRSLRSLCSPLSRVTWTAVTAPAEAQASKDPELDAQTLARQKAPLGSLRRGFSFSAG